MIEWNGSQSTVQPNEVLNGDEAAELFVSYLNTGREPAGYSRRRIDL